MNLEMIRGTTNTFDIHVNDANGEPYTLASGEKVVFGIKYRPYQATAALVKTTNGATASGTDGVYPITIEPNDTINLKYGEYFYDVNIQSGDQFYPVVSGKFLLKPNATRHGDGA